MLKMSDEKKSDVKSGLEVPYNWDLQLLDRFEEINASTKTKFQIKEIYCADPFSITGSGRSGSALTKREQPWSEHISRAHDAGINFNYLFNAISLAGREWNGDFIKNFLSTVEQLVKDGVDVVTITNLRLNLLVKQYFTELYVASSVGHHLDSVERIRQWLIYTNADRIMLDARASRQFKLVGEIRNAFPDKDISVLVTESCLWDCVLHPFHLEHESSISRQDSQNSKPPPDLCHMFCATEKLENPVNTLKAPWLRPEDIKYLVNSGADLIKLAGRTKDSAWIDELATIYANGEFDGDIFKFIEKSGLISPDWEDLLDRKMKPARYKVDNKALDGFIEPFLNGSTPCVKDSKYGCADCTWCHDWLHAVSEPENKVERAEDMKVLLSKIKMPDGFAC
jgi:collagenase-like PrtC family protease